MAHYRSDKGSRHVEIADGLSMQLPGALRIDDEPTAGRAVILHLDNTAAGVRPVGVEVVATNGEPVTGTDLRQVRVAELLREHVRPFVQIAGGVDQFGRKIVVDGPMIPTEIELELMRLRGPVPETLAMVARLYQLARALGEPPALYVKNELGVSKPTAGRWIRKAREEQLINDPGSDDGDN